MPALDVQPEPSRANLDTLSSVVFERTELGTAAVKSSASDIPRKLRDLLLVVDGRSDVAQYEPFLSALSPLPEKFDELERLGYVRRKRNEKFPASKLTEDVTQLFNLLKPAKAAIANMAPAPAASLTEADLLNFALDLAALKGPNLEASANSLAPELQTLATRLNAHPEADLVATGIAPYSSLGGSTGAGNKVHTDRPTLQDLLEEMENFLSSVAGLDGLPLALMFGQITSLAQLRRELPAYLEVLQPYGAQADVHVERLADLLDRAQS